MNFVLLAARLVLAFVFAFAAISKLTGGLTSFRKSINEFGVPDWMSSPLSFVLPLCELAAAFLLIPAATSRLGAVVACLLLLLFDVAIAFNLIAGRRPSCNCFGQIHSKPIGWGTFSRNAILATAACGVIWRLPIDGKAGIADLFNSLSHISIAIGVSALVSTIGFATLGFLTIHLFRQNGRLLLRIEALEARPAAPWQQGQAIGHPVPAFFGLPIASKAVPFDLPTTEGSRETLDTLLSRGKPIMLISSDPNCGPCNALMPEVVKWQGELSEELTVVLLSHGMYSENQKKAAEFGVRNVLFEKKHEIAEKYQALGTPTAVLVRADGTIGSPAMSGAEGIRQLVATKAWTESGFVAFMAARSLPFPPIPPKPKLPVGSPVPHFTLPDLNGTAIRSADFNGNGTVLLFWNPACGFCQTMLPQLKEWERARAQTAPRLVLVSTGSREANRAMDLESTVLLDEKFAVGQSCGASGTPSGLFIDVDGKIASTLSVGAPGVMALLSAERTPTDTLTAAGSRS